MSNNSLLDVRKGQGRSQNSKNGDIPSPADYGFRGSVVSSPSGVLGTAPAENDFATFWGARTALIAILVANFAFPANFVAEPSPTWM